MGRQTHTVIIVYTYGTYKKLIPIGCAQGEKKIKNGYPESSKVCYSINLKKYIWCIQNHCIANFSELQFNTNAIISAMRYQVEVSKGAKIRNRSNQVPHLTQDTNGKVKKLTADTTNKSQEVSRFPAGDHKAHINRRAQRHSKHKTEQKHKRSTKEVPPWNGQ